MKRTRTPRDPRLDLKGVRKRGDRWQVYSDIGGAQRVRTLQNSDPTEEELIAARRLLTGDVVTVKKGSLADDVAEFLSRRSAQAGIQSYTTNLRIWMDELGRDRLRKSITAAEVDRVVQRWQTFVPSPVTPITKRNRFGKRKENGTLRPSTIRARLAALQSLFVVLDGKHATNPVRACSTRPPEEKAITRAIPMETVAAILAAMREGPNKIRATVQAYTGLDASQVQRLERGHVDLAGRQFYATRLKGGVIVADWLPMCDEAHAGFTAFVAADLFGPFSARDVHGAVRRAARRIQMVGWQTFRVKDFRHSFLTEMFRLTGDMSTVARLAMHSVGSRMTHRYTKAAHVEVNRAAVDAFSQRRKDVQNAAAQAEPAAVVNLSDRQSRRSPVK